ncbi:MAG: peptidylprolyl isomerase [Alphaproteobacteria bacterium]|nr:peptidylprolyl isomerase [Alphaproteobacteria bacterium]MDD9919102.1 peptidylprolyl isomerase [Alphaproteobacteria bacterium]
MYTKIFITALAFLAFITSPSNALEDGVIAVVNDGIVLDSEVEERINLTMRQMGTTYLPTRRREILKQQILSNMVDEELQKQESQRKRIHISQQDIDKAVTIIEHNNNLPSGGYEEAVKGLEQVATQKITAEIRWRKLIGKSVRPNVIVSNVEVDRLINEMLSAQQVTERELAQIFITTDENNVNTEQKVRDVYQQLENGEATFEQLAKTYSNDAAAVRGGTMGWFAPGEMLSELEQVVEHLNPGEFSQPIRGPQGWHILKVLRQRATQTISTKPSNQLDLWEVKLTKIEDRQTNHDNISLLKKAYKKWGSAEDVKQFLSENNDNASFSNSSYLGWQDTQKLTEQQLKAISRVRNKGTSRLIETEDGWTVYFVAAKRTVLPEKLDEYRARVKERLLENRVDLEARKFMRELRERAFIDIRL